MLRKGSIEDLSCLKNFNKLKNVELFLLKNLTSINDLHNCINLNYLEIESCRNIKDLEQTLVLLDNLEYLTLVGFTLNTISWVKKMKSLKSLSILDSNIKDGDLSPALNLEYAAFDNKRHYSHKYDGITKKLIPKAKSFIAPSKKSFKLKYFGEVDLENLDISYESQMTDNQLTFSIDLNFESKRIIKSKLDIVKHVLSATPSAINLEMISILKSVPDHESIAIYKEFIEDEFDMQYKEVSDFLESLQLKRIGFYPETDDDCVVFDMQPKDLDLDHLICLRMNRKTMIVDISIES